MNVSSRLREKIIRSTRMTRKNLSLLGLVSCLFVDRRFCLKVTLSRITILIPGLVLMLLRGIARKIKEGAQVRLAPLA